MGLDISSDTGVVVTLDEFLSLIQPEHVQGIRVDGLALYYRKLAEEQMAGRTPSYTKKLQSDDYSEEYRDLDEEWQALINRIEKAESVEEIREAIGAVIRMCAHTPSAELDVLDLFYLLITSITPVFSPLPVGVAESEEGPRISGDDVPVDEPFVVFSNEECFETRLSAQGRALANALGRTSLRPETWTSQSY